MSRILAVCLVLALASVSLAADINPWLAQSWEDGGGDIASWGPTIVGGQTIGVTDGALSAAVVASTGWGFIGQVAGFPDAYGNTVNSTAFDTHTTVSLDVTVVGADWSAGDNGYQFGLVVNSGSTGWQQADVGAWYSGLDGADFTQTVSFDYQALKNGSPSGWAQIVLYQNSYSNDSSMSTAIYYLDNLRLTGFGTIPEPATMALLGLGGLALIRRKK